MMMYYRHKVFLKYQNSAQLNRHAARLIDTEGFMSAGSQGEGLYGFVKDIDEATFNKLVAVGRKHATVKGAEPPLTVVYEQRIAW